MMKSVSTKQLYLSPIVILLLSLSAAFAVDDSLRTDTAGAPGPDTTDTLAADTLPTLSRDLYYRVTVDLPGKTAQSYCRGLCQVRCGMDIFWEGTFNLPDLSTEEGCVVQREITVSGTSLDSLELQWSFRGVIYDSQLDIKYGPFVTEQEMLDSTIEAIGFHIQIDADSTLLTEKRVYRK